MLSLAKQNHKVTEAQEVRAEQQLHTHVKVASNGTELERIPVICSDQPIWVLIFHAWHCKLLDFHFTYIGFKIDLVSHLCLHQW